MNKRYNYAVLQRGSLPLSPDREVDRSIPHQCSSVLIWPEHESPNSQNSILTDPCYTFKGYEYAKKKLTKLRISLEDIGYIFITHRHGDHLPNFVRKKKFVSFQVGMNTALSDFNILHCPGHSPRSQALVFRSMLDETVCIAGDAVLDVKWLKAWEYYWPNQYFAPDIVQTWKSVVKILSIADTIIPGHGDQIYVTTALVKELLSTFPEAECAGKCQDIPQILRKRQEELLLSETKKNAEKLRKDQ